MAVLSVLIKTVFITHYITQLSIPMKQEHLLVAVMSTLTMTALLTILTMKLSTIPDPMTS